MASLHTGFAPTRRRSPWGALIALTGILSALWLPLANAADKTASDYFVNSLPGAPSPLLKMHAGHVEITPEHHGNMFFWLFQNRHIANRQRTVIWLNGGPGCSSMDGAMMEVGPYRVNEDGTLRLNEGSWDEFSNILFVDNPVGTGFSYVDGDSYLKELDEMADQFIVFLEKWFKLFPEFSQDDLYLAGESYAGQHIPYIAKAILDRNEKNSGSHWNLSGLLIGNGWISGPDQYLSYIPYAYEQNLVQSGSDLANKLEAQQAVCVKDLDNGGKDHVDVSSCEAILQDMLNLGQKDGNCFNMYDVRKTDEYPSCGMNWPPDLAHVTPYLRRQDVTSALHINPDKKAGWRECNNQVSGAFRAAKSKPSRELLPGLLEKVPILLFSGDKDLICNHIGTENLINDLQWNGGTGMEISPGTWAPRRDWTFEGESAGIYQTARNLTYVTFFNASHMVPFDYPRRTRDMLDRFLGVDIASIGGTPADSRIDGEKGLETSVGGHPNSTAAEEAEQDKLENATWDAYRRSGEVALVIILIMAGAWGFFVWRDRRQRRGYRGVFPSDDDEEGGGGGLRLDGFADRLRGRRHRDVEAADFDEAELDDLAGDGSRNSGERRESKEQFGLHDEDEDHDSEVEGGHGGKRANGHT